MQSSNPTLLLLITFLLFATYHVSAKNVNTKSEPLNVLGSPIHHGKYNVGFKTIDAKDYARSHEILIDEQGKKLTHSQPRHVQIAIWYPTASNAEPMKYSDYLILQDSAQKELPFNDDDFLRRKKGYVELSKLSGAKEKLVIKNYNYPMQAIRNAPSLEGSFPLVMYIPKAHRQVYENTVMIERLVSNGYIVATTANRARDFVWPQDGFFSDKDQMMVSIEDARFAKGYMHNFENINYDKVALLAMWEGAYTALAMANTDYSIDAIINLSGRGPSVKIAKHRDNDPKYFSENISYWKPKKITTDIFEIRADLENNFFARTEYIDEAPFSNRLIYDMTDQRFWSMSSEFIIHYSIANGDDASEYVKHYDITMDLVENYLDEKLKGKSTSWKNKYPHKLKLLTGANPPLSPTQFMALINSKDVEAAFKEFNRVRTIDSEYKPFLPYMMVGAAYSKSDEKKYKDANDIMEMATIAYPEDVNNWDTKGELLMTSSQNKQALNAYETALSLNPSTKQLQNINKQITLLKRQLANKGAN